MVRCYCKEYLNFVPTEVNPQYFELKLANNRNQEDPIIDAFSLEEDIKWLFECGNLVLLRQHKSKERMIEWQKTLDSHDMEVLELIIPGQREIIEKVERNKTIASLKEKIKNQIQYLDKIIIVTYHDLRICENKWKISDLVASTRTLEVYSQVPSKFEDSVQMKDKPEVAPHQPELTSKFELGESFFHGKLHVEIKDKTIIER